MISLISLLGFLAIVYIPVILYCILKECNCIGKNPKIHPVNQDDDPVIVINPYNKKEKCDDPIV